MIGKTTSAFLAQMEGRPLADWPKTFDEAVIQTARLAMLEALQAGVCDIEFTKVDGTPSKMRGTLHPDLLPSREGETASRSTSPDLLHVYSLDRGGWRSVKVMNVTKLSTYPWSPSS